MYKKLQFCWLASNLQGQISLATLKKYPSARTSTNQGVKLNFLFEKKYLLQGCDLVGEANIKVILFSLMFIAFLIEEAKKGQSADFYKVKISQWHDKFSTWLIAQM